MDTRESVSEAEQERWEAEILAALDGADYYDALDVAKYNDTTLDEVQRICGARGHEMETFDQGDPMTPHFQTWRCCALCGAPDEYEGDDEP